MSLHNVLLVKVALNVSFKFVFSCDHSIIFSLHALHISKQLFKLGILIFDHLLELALS